MTALAEALLAAQRQAIGALCKAYIAGAFEDDGDAGLIANLDRIGATDAVDQSYLRECLDTLRTWGTPTNGATPKPSPETEPASQRQLRLSGEARRRERRDGTGRAEVDVSAYIWPGTVVIVAVIADNAVLNICRTFGKRER